MFETAALGSPGGAATIHVAFDVRRRLGSHYASLSGSNFAARTLAVYAS